jgi:hypothetical protein
MRYVILDATQTVCAAFDGPDAPAPPAAPGNTIVASDTADAGDVYADGVFTTPGQGA